LFAGYVARDPNDGTNEASITTEEEDEEEDEEEEDDDDDDGARWPRLFDGAVCASQCDTSVAAVATNNAWLTHADDAADITVRRHIL